MLPRIKVPRGILHLATALPPTDGRLLNISFAIGDEPPYKSYIQKLEESKIISFLDDDNIIANLEPLLGQNKVQIIYFPPDESGKNMTFVYIEGTRCKSDGLNKRCWSDPSFCLGWEQFCFEADDQFSLCNNQELDPSTKFYKESSLIDSSKLLWVQPDIMSIIGHDQSEAEVIDSEQILHNWQCSYGDLSKPRNVTYVLCTAIPRQYWIYTNIVDKERNLKFLKSISG